jgi:hypothetical protein
MSPATSGTYAGHHVDLAADVLELEGYLILDRCHSCRE